MQRNTAEDGLMKKLYKGLPVLLCAALMLTLCGCGGDQGHKHEYESTVITEAGCEETGPMKYTCPCGDEYEDSIPAKGHDFVAGEVVQPTLFSNGYTVYTCTRCGATETGDITQLINEPIELPDIPLE